MPQPLSHRNREVTNVSCFKLLGVWKYCLLCSDRELMYSPFKFGVSTAKFLLSLIPPLPLVTLLTVQNHKVLLLVLPNLDHWPEQMFLRGKGGE